MYAKGNHSATLDEAPEDVNLDAFVERPCLLEKIELAEQQLAAGQGIPHEEVKQRLSQWLD